MKGRSEAGIEQLWDLAGDIVRGTRYCITQNVDENAWGMRVIHEVLKWETSGSERKYMKPAFSRVENMRVSPALEPCTLIN